MSLTPMQAHIKRVRDAQAKADLQMKLDAGESKAADNTTEDYSAFEVLKSSLDSDVKALSALPKEDRDNMRADVLIPRYENHVKSYIDAGEVYANPVLVYMIIWLIDLARLGPALALAKIAIKQAQAMPQQFKSNLATFVADQVLSWSETEIKLGNSPEPYFSEVCTQLESWPVKDVVKMKYAKTAGNIAFDNGDFKTAETLYFKAIKLETPAHKAKVSTKLAAAQKKIEEQAEATTGKEEV